MTTTDVQGRECGRPRDHAIAETFYRVNGGRKRYATAAEAIAVANDYARRSGIFVSVTAHKARPTRARAA